MDCSSTLETVPASSDVAAKGLEPGTKERKLR
jgi:hypothetical protein